MKKSLLNYCGLSGVKRLKNTVKALPKISCLIIVIVRLADVCDKEKTDNIRKYISLQVSEQILRDTPVFYLRHGIDYQKLTFKHRTEITLLCNKAKNFRKRRKQLK